MAARKTKQTAAAQQPEPSANNRVTADYLAGKAEAVRGSHPELAGAFLAAARLLAPDTLVVLAAVPGGVRSGHDPERGAWYVSGGAPGAGIYVEAAGSLGAALDRFARAWVAAEASP